MSQHILRLLFFVPYFATAQLCPPQDEAVNDFDWTTPYFDCRVMSTLTQVVDTVVIPSPFNPDYYHLNTQAFAADLTGRFFHPDYGWELVTAQMGWIAPARWPSFALYNRYTGVFRQFFYARDLEEADLIELYLGFDHKLTPIAPAVFSHFEGSAPALEAYENNGFSIFYRMAYLSGLDGVWIWAASNTAYDPCTCLNPARLSVSTYSYNQIGELIDIDPQNGIQHDLPGSKPLVEGLPARQPSYNEIMGVFNLMETPTVWQAEAYVGKEYTERGCEVLYDYSFQLEDSLRFAFNPAAGLELLSVEGQFRFRCDNEWRFSDFVPINCLPGHAFAFEEVARLADLPSCDEVKLVIQVKSLPENPGPNTPDTLIYEQGYAVKTAAAPYTFEDRPQPPSVWSSNDCGAPIPVGVDYLSAFCNDPRRYDPILRPAEPDPATPILESGLAHATVYPNPACSLAWLEWEQESESLLRWYMTDIAGRQIGGERQLQLLPPGRYRQPLSLESLPAGLYLVMLDNGSSKKVLKLIKR